MLRPRRVTIDATASTAGARQWHAQSAPPLRGRPGEPDGDVAVFAAGHPERPGVPAAPAVGTLEYGSFGERAPGHVMLTASADTAPLYGSLGFCRDSDPSMRLYP